MKAEKRGTFSKCIKTQMQTSFVAVNLNTVAWLLLDIFPSLSFSFLPNLVPPIFWPRSSRGLRNDFFLQFTLIFNWTIKLFFYLDIYISLFYLLSMVPFKLCLFYLDFYTPFRLWLQFPSLSVILVFINFFVIFTHYSSIYFFRSRSNFGFLQYFFSFYNSGTYE